MIYILVGDDNLNKSLYIKEITLNGDIYFIKQDFPDKSLIMSYSDNISLFGELKVIIIDNILDNKDINFSTEELSSLKESKTIFILKQDKLSSVEQKKYKKYGEIKIFESKKITPVAKFNIFSLTDAFSDKDKINTWIIYRQGILSGIEPEAIAGILFWKIKMMILNGSRKFNKEELKLQSSSIVSIYHKAHRGEMDFVVALEQFILSSLSSR